MTYVLFGETTPFADATDVATDGLFRKVMIKKRKQRSEALRISFQGVSRTVGVHRLRGEGLSWIGVWPL